MKETSLLNYLNQFNADEICWYPSAGLDLMNVNLWNSNYDNKFKPRLFVFSDICYEITSENIRGENNPNNDFQFKFSPEMSAAEIKFEDFNFLDENVMNQYKGTLNHPYIEFDEFLESKNINPENQEERDAISVVFNMGLLSKENDLIEISHRKTYEYYSQQPAALKIEYNNVTILFIKSSNEKLFDFFVKNKIEISCFMVQRSMDNFIYNFDGFNILSIKEVIASEKYLPNLNKSGYHHLDNDFIWNSYGNHDPNNFVWKII
jgi:hypothetical protein